MTKLYSILKTIFISSLFLLSTYGIVHSQCGVQLTGLESEYCITGGGTSLDVYPLGGTLSGPGISGDYFDPGVAGAGAHEIKYVFDSIFYNIYTDGTFNPIDGVGTSFSLSDDDVSAFLPLGFTFNFFGTDYTEIKLSSNGFLTFNNIFSSGCCQGHTVPNTSDPDNIIAFAWSDLNPNEGGSFQYFTIGTAPNRIFVVDVKNLSHYGFPGRVTSQIQLYETTNIIEIHTTEMTYGGAVHTMGIENVDGTIGFAVDGRNASIWSAAEEMVQFVPEHCTDSVIVNVTVNDAPATVELSTTSINYGNVETGATYTQELTITNTGCNSLTIDSLRNDSLEFSYTFSDDYSLAGGNSVTVEIQFQSSDLETLTDTLFVYTDVSDNFIALSATVIEAPVMVTLPDTARHTINSCTGNYNETLEIYNNGDGELNYTITQYEQFSEDFEDGNHDGWIMDHEFTTVEVQNSEAAIGDYALYLSGQDGDGEGMVLNIDPRQATYISFWFKPDFLSWGGGTIEMEDDEGDKVIDISFYVDGARYFYDNIDNNEFYIIEENWYHIEFKNVDFKNNTYDWYVDGEFADAISFSGSADYISKIIITSEYASEFYIDDIYIGDEVAWLDILHPQNTITGMNSVETDIVLNADGLMSGTYEKYVFVNGNDPENLMDTIVYILTVDGTPEAELSVSSIDFGDVFVGDSIIESVSLTNTGCDTLFISSITQPEDSTEFEFTNLTGTTIPPGEALEATIKFKTDSVSTYSSTISFFSNATTQNLTLNGSFVTNPLLTLSTDTITYNVSCTEEVSQSFTISNANVSDLNFQIDINDIDLESVLTSLNTNYQSIIDLIPNRYDFDYGNYDTYIESGGDYMYDEGNYLSTNIGGNLVYSDNTIIPSSLLGDEGKYFVRKYNGLFVFAGKLDGVSDFTIDGSLDNWGAEIDGAILEYEYNGIIYYGFVKRVYGANSPSVNHLLITRNPEVIHDFSSSSSNDAHTLSNLEKSSELFYLLYAGTYGAYIDDDETMAIMQEFIHSIVPFAPSYVTPNVTSGTVNNGSQDVNVTVSGTNFNVGTHYRELLIVSNAPGNMLELLTLEINVTGDPGIDTDAGSLSFGNVAITDSLTKELTIYNTGCDTLFLTNITSSEAQYNVDTTELEILPGMDYTIMVEFKPEAVQSYPADLTIESDAGNTTVSLSGSGVNTGPQIDTDSTTFTMALECENEKTGMFKVYNTGEADLVIEISDDLTELELSESEATILANDSLEIDVTFLGEEALAGTYSGNIFIASNDGATPLKQIPVSIDDAYNKVTTIDIGWEDEDLCQGEEINIDAGYGFSSYSWSTSEETQTITVSTTGNYVATVFDYNGCESADSVDVNVHNPVVNLGADVDICFGESTNLDAGSGFTTYGWSTAEVTQTISVNTTGTYSVTVTDEYACNADDEIVVTVNDLPVVDLGTDVNITTSETTTLDAGNGFASYLWSDQSSSQTLTVDGSVVGVGTHDYSVVVTDVNGCEGTDDINVIVTASTGIDELGSEILSAYPNPVKENLYIQFNPEFNQNVTIRIYDLIGTLKYIEEVNEINPDRLHKVQLSELDLHSGIYLLKINNEELNFVEQIIIE